MLSYLAVFIIMFFSGSPFTGMLVLFLLSIFLSLVLGMKNSWLFMVLVLVYVGGIMIMFTYLTSVLTYSKITLISFRWGVVILFFISALSGSLTTSPHIQVSVWPAISFLCETTPFLFFLVNYMLLTLVSIFLMVSKEDGPMKMK